MLLGKVKRHLQILKKRICTRRHSHVETPQCPQELTQTPSQTELTALVTFMNSCLTLNQNSYSNDETEDETTMSQSDDEPTDNELSQSLTTQKN